MKIYWYWPNPHRAASIEALSTLRPGDQLTVHALPSLFGEMFGDVPEYEVIRTLPDPTAMPSDGPLGFIRPARLAIGRSRARARVLKRGFDLVYLGLLFHHTDWAEIGHLRRRSPLLSHVHDVLPHSYRAPEVLERSALRRLYRSAGHLVVYHDVLKGELVDEFGVDPKLVHVVRIPFDARDRRDPSEPAPLRPRLLYFGRIRSNKGIDVLVDALESLGTRLDADVVIAGNTDETTRADIQRRIGNLPHVSLELHYITAERKHELLSQATWLVVPYTSFHSQSALISDAYPYRLPLIASDVGALGATVREDASGIVVPPSNADKLAEALVLAADLSTDGFVTRIADVAGLYDYGVTCPQLRDIFDVVVDDR